MLYSNVIVIMLCRDMPPHIEDT